MAERRKERLTNKLIKTLKPADKDYRVWDLDTPGLYLHVLPSGKRVFRFYYRLHGTPRTLTVGHYGTYTIPQAQSAAKHYRGQLAQDIDPYTVKIEKRADADREKVILLRDFIDRKYGPWLRAYRKVGAETETNLNVVWADFLDRRMDDITSADMEAWVLEQITAGSKPVTINRKLDDIRALYNRAVRWGIVEANPAAKLERPKTVGDPRVRYLTDDEEVALFDALDARDAKAVAQRRNMNKWRAARGYEELPEIEFKDFLTPLVVTALYTGTRRGELLQANWNLVNLDLRTMTVSAHDAKSAKTRHIPLNDEVVNILTRWKAQTGGSGVVFPNPVNGESMTRVKGSWDKVLKDAGITGFRFHDMRHDFASKLVMAGVDLNTVRELLGHASLEMTLRYAHLAPEHKAAAVDLLKRK